MIKRIVSTASVSLLLLSPVSAQFGLGGGRKKAASFQELNEQAKQMQGEDGLGDLAKLQEMMMGGGGGAGGAAEMAKLQEMWAESLNDPETLKQMEAMQDQLKEAMDVMAKMSPEQLQQQMQDAMQMMQSGDMMQKMMQNMDKQELLKMMESYGMVPEDELEKMKTDPEYLEQKLEESLEQMSELFKDPEIMKAATDAMTGMKEVYENPNILAETMKELLGDFESDEKIEEARLMLLKDANVGYPELKEAFETDEMKEILSDPVKWRESVKEGLRVGGGAGIGEL